MGWISYKELVACHPSSNGGILFRNQDDDGFEARIWINGIQGLGANIGQF